MNGGSLPAFERGTEWLRGVGEACDVVMSSRVRLARNLAGRPFQTTADDAERGEVLELVRTALDGADMPVVAGDLGRGVASGERMSWLDLRMLSDFERELLVERQLVSRQHARGQVPGSGPRESLPRGVAIGLPGERVSVMVNEEDHLRVQAVCSGLSLEQALREADAVDDALEGRLDYAYSPRFGYLTACPTNVGTGLRLSVMLHLPALKMTGDIEKVRRAADGMALAVRGFHGEGSEHAGDFYQLSNQTTLGKSERMLLDEIGGDLIPRVIDYERHARRELMTRKRVLIEDRVHRAHGALLGARLLEADEAMELLSLVRLGVVLGLIDGLAQQAVNGLVLGVQPAHLRRLSGADLSQHQRCIERARLVRERLARGERERAARDVPVDGPGDRAGGADGVDVDNAGEGAG